jgi:hypothetical protein
MPYSSQVERRPHGCYPRTPESLCISIAERSRLMLRPSNVTLKEYQHADTEENNERWPSDLVTPFWLVETSGRFYEQAVVIRRGALARRRTSEILGDLHIGIMISSGSPESIRRTVVRQLHHHLRAVMWINW